eukprot:gb/GECH01001752.1/.p1 GENE.gb/GECH01001752.1/~~gb/GECH01001752.1/.p1  ORF type:complete len:481 (+),score=114.08 gb/GECH01001752.1/:1-1443(+)
MSSILFRDVLVLIFSFSPPETLLSASCINHEWRELIFEYHFWRRSCVTRYISSIYRHNLSSHETLQNQEISPKSDGVLTSNQYNSGDNIYWRNIAKKYIRLEHNLWNKKFQEYKLRGHSSEILSTVISKSLGIGCSGGSDSALILWSMNSSNIKPISQFNLSGPVTCLEILDNILFAATENGAIYSIPLNNGDPLRSRGDLSATPSFCSSQPIRCMAPFPSSVNVRDGIKTNEFLMEENHDHRDDEDIQISRINYTPQYNNRNNNIVLIGVSNKIVGYDAREGNRSVAFEMRGHTQPVNCLSVNEQATEYRLFNNDSHHDHYSNDLDQIESSSVPSTAEEWFVVSGSNDKTVRLWDIRMRRFLRTMRGHRSAVKCVQRRGNRILSGGGFQDQGAVRLWNSRTGKQMRQIRIPSENDVVQCLAFDGYKMMIGGNKSFSVWNVMGDNPIWTYPVAVNDFGFDDQFISVASKDWNLRVFDLNQ